MRSCAACWSIRYIPSGPSAMMNIVAAWPMTRSGGSFAGADSVAGGAIGVGMVCGELHVASPVNSGVGAAGSSSSRPGKAICRADGTNAASRARVVISEGAKLSVGANDGASQVVAAGASSITVARTARCTARNTASPSRKRTSVLAGCTFTSTSSTGSITLTKATGKRFTGSSVWYAWMMA